MANNNSTGLPFPLDENKRLKKCLYCDRIFLNKKNLLQHEIQHKADNKKLKCSLCNKRFQKRCNFILHQKQCQQESTGTFENEKIGQHGAGHSVRENDNFKEIESALKKTAAVYRKSFGDTTDLQMLKDIFIGEMCSKLKEEVDKRKNIKWFAGLKLEFCMASDNTIITNPPINFNSETCILLVEDQEEEIILQCQVAFNNIIHQIEEFSKNGSGWILDQLLNLDINIIDYDPLRAGTYLPLPPNLKHPNKGNLNV